MLLEAAQPTKQTPNPAPANVYKKAPNFEWLPALSLVFPARKKGILEMAYHQFSSFVSEVEQLSSYQTEVEPKTLSGSRRKSTSEELISKTQKYVSHFLTGMC